LGRFEEAKASYRIALDSMNAVHKKMTQSLELDRYHGLPEKPITKKTVEIIQNILFETERLFKSMS
jgi:hypothetical protein